MHNRLELAVAGDRLALSELLHERHEELLAFIERKMSAELRSRVEAVDVLQDTFCDAFRDIGRLQANSDAALLPWLRSIAENRLIDVARYYAAQKRGGDADHVEMAASGEGSKLVSFLDSLAGESSTPSVKLIRAEGLAALHAELALLPVDYRVALTCKELEGLSIEQTAERMGRTKDEVRGLLFRGRKLLAEKLGSASGYQFRE